LYPRHLAGGIVAKVLSRLARTPGGGSKVMMRPARSRLTGILGVISQVKKSLKMGKESDQIFD
jgi:hypothetical protein